MSHFNNLVFGFDRTQALFGIHSAGAADTVHTQALRHNIPRLEGAMTPTCLEAGKRLPGPITRHADTLALVPEYIPQPHFHRSSRGVAMVRGMECFSFYLECPVIEDADSHCYYAEIERFSSY